MSQTLSPGAGAETTGPQSAIAHTESLAADTLRDCRSR